MLKEEIAVRRRRRSKTMLKEEIAN